MIFTMIYSCKKDNDEVIEKAVCGSCQMEVEMRRVSNELNRFDSIIINLYEKINDEPKFVLKEIEKIEYQLNSETDSLKIKDNKVSLVTNLKIETLYRMGEYQKSINEIEHSAKLSQRRFDGEINYSENDFIHLACNYVKLKDFEKAKELLSKAGVGWYITNFINANFYEVIGNKEMAIKKYEEIVSDISMDHYYHYRHSKIRLLELKKSNPKLLTELFYPSDRSDAKITVSDNGIRNKVFDTIWSIPECKNCGSVSVFKEPRESSRYWMKAKSKKIIYNFLVDTLSFEIFYLDTINKKEIPLSEWRKGN
ncbi:hypothetical protein SAMN06296427_11123 [Moheibacter sediminis]|uniref:Tetratricopeptide repeat-containing protein n=2 Tax=Moheibacter sediminis TaxID=1434700 RepID=A0A1W2CQ85_9FLAO|nr:hypothetical protein SAMN06296427_11123 [Moheibacter sediminis]